MVLGARVAPPDVPAVKAALDAALAGIASGPAERRDDLLIVDVPRERLVEAARIVRDNEVTRCNFISIVSGIDTGEKLGSVAIVHGVESGAWVAIRAWCSELDPHIPTLVDVWPGVNWHERESYDMFGIIYDGHPDLRRVFLEDSFPGHPLRKSFLAPRSDARGG